MDHSSSLGSLGDSVVGRANSLVKLATQLSDTILDAEAMEDNLAHGNMRLSAKYDESGMVPNGSGSRGSFAANSSSPGSTGTLDAQKYYGFRGSMYRMLYSNGFHLLIATTIITNLSLMLYETDQNAPCASHANLDECKIEAVEVLNLIFLGIYTIEAMIRIFVFQCDVIRDRWNILDMCIVVGGYLDIVLAALAATNELPGPGIAFLRIFRVARVIRAVRIFRQIPELHAMMRGFISAMRSMFWGLVMIMIVILLFSMLCVQLVHPISLRVHQENDFCREAFGTIWFCVLLFFQTLVAGDSWGDCVVPVVKEEWWTFGIFACALTCVQFGVMSLILAVIVEQATHAAQEDDEAIRNEKQRSARKATDMLQKMCSAIDTNQNGRITFEEVMEGFDTNEEFENLFARLDLGRRDVGVLFDLMDAEDEGELSYEAFIDNLRAALHGNDQMSVRMLRLQVAEIARNVKQLRKTSRNSMQHSSSEIFSQPSRTNVWRGTRPLIQSQMNPQASEASKVPVQMTDSVDTITRGSDSNPQVSFSEEVSAVRGLLDAELLDFRDKTAELHGSLLHACQASFAYQSSSIEKILGLMKPPELPDQKPLGKSASRQSRLSYGSNESAMAETSLQVSFDKTVSMQSRLSYDSNASAGSFALEMASQPVRNMSASPSGATGMRNMASDRSVSLEPGLSIGSNMSSLPNEAAGMRNVARPPPNLSKLVRMMSGIIEEED